MGKAYTRTELETMVLEQINAIKGAETAFDATAATAALDEAVRECGFDVPLADDSALDIKNQWLIERMRQWFLRRLWERYSLRFDAGDLKAQQIALNLERLCQKNDERFALARSSDDSAGIFASAELMFGKDPIVIGTGLIEDRIGQPIEER